VSCDLIFTVDSKKYICCQNSKNLHKLTERIDSKRDKLDRNTLENQILLEYMDGNINDSHYALIIIGRSFDLGPSCSIISPLYPSAELVGVPRSSFFSLRHIDSAV
jgi:hypothetical protein